MTTVINQGKIKEAGSYATRAKIHLVYSWLLKHCLDLNDRHKAAILNELALNNVKFLELKKQSLSDSPYMMQFDETDYLEELETVSLLRSFPPMKYGIKVIEHEINKAFYGDLRGVPGFYFKRGLFRLNLPSWHGLIKPYYDRDEKITGLYLYKSIRDGLPRLLSSHDLPLGKKFVEPVSRESEVFIF